MQQDRSLCVHGIGHYKTRLGSDEGSVGWLEFARFADLGGSTIAPPSDNQRCDIYLFDTEALSSELRRARRFLPDKWDETKPPSYPARLLDAWHIACEAAILAYLHITQEHSVEWCLGWYPATTSTKSVLKTDGRFAIFCLNPFRPDGALAYDLSSKADHRGLLAIAKHEAAHLKHLEHDAAFSSLHTSINMRVDDDAVVAAMQEAASTTMSRAGVATANMFLANGTQLRLKQKTSIRRAVIAGGEVHAEGVRYPSVEAYLKSILGAWNQLAVRRFEDADWLRYTRPAKTKTADQKPAVLAVKSRASDAAALPADPSPTSRE